MEEIIVQTTIISHKPYLSRAKWQPEAEKEKQRWRYVFPQKTPRKEKPYELQCCFEDDQVILSHSDGNYYQLLSSLKEYNGNFKKNMFEIPLKDYLGNLRGLDNVDCGLRMQFQYNHPGQDNGHLEHCPVRVSWAQKDGKDNKVREERGFISTSKFYLADVSLEMEIEPVDENGKSFGVKIPIKGVNTFVMKLAAAQAAINNE